MNGTGKTLIKYGTLPTAYALHAPARENGTTAYAVRSLCRRSMEKTRGPNDQVRELLRALGFEWSATESDLAMQEDVEAVQAALDDEVAQ